jgi:hypothetical protein
MSLGQNCGLAAKRESAMSLALAYQRAVASSKASVSLGLGRLQDLDGDDDVIVQQRGHRPGTAVSRKRS